MTPPATVGITRAGLADVGVLGSVVADAFLDLPPSRWLIPDRRPRREAFPAYFSLYVEHGVNAGVVWTTPDRLAVAIWLPWPLALAEPEGYPHRLAAITKRWAPRFHEFDDTIAVNHPTASLEHDWLTILAVHPDAQGHGVGGALMRHHHDLLDEAERPAYLEAASLPDRDWYRSRGWHDIGEPFTLPERGPSLFPMWRDPRPVIRP
jgi:GNAT superfamily N-acetyltransferase